MIELRSIIIGQTFRNKDHYWVKVLSVYNSHGLEIVKYKNLFNNDVVLETLDSFMSANVDSYEDSHKYKNMSITNLLEQYGKDTVYLKNIL